MSTTAVDTADALAAAPAAYDEAEREWRAAVDLDEALAHPNSVDGERLDRLGMRSLWRDVGGRPELDRVELDVRRARAGQRRAEAALAFGEARDMLAAAKIAVASDALPESVSDYKAAVRDLADELDWLERAYAEIVVCAWRVRAARLAENRAASRITKIVKDATSSETREELAAKVALRTVPVELGADGPRYVGRPEVGILLSSEAANNPAAAEFWTALGRLARSDEPEKALRNVGGMLRDLIEEARTRIDNEQR